MTDLFVSSTFFNRMTLAAFRFKDLGSLLFTHGCYLSRICWVGSFWCNNKKALWSIKGEQNDGGYR